MAQFEKDLDELERVVEQLERGDLTLEESVQLFERGTRLSQSCKDALAHAESRIQAIVAPESAGPVRVEDLAMAVAEEESDDESGFDDGDDSGDQEE